MPTIIVWLLFALSATACSSRPPDPMFTPIATPGAESDPTHAVFSAPSIGVAFEYPHQWLLQADRRDQGAAAYLDLHFTTEDGATASVVLRRVRAEDGPLAAWVRTNARDPQRLLTLSPCAFPSRALECLEVTDQTRWTAGGHAALDSTVFLKAPGFVYGVGWTSSPGFDYAATGGRILLQSLRFGER
ncbi:MAG: hypothetical protein U0360_00245 [Dehalococcoidia bacterium]